MMMEKYQALTEMWTGLFDIKLGQNYQVFDAE